MKLVHLTYGIILLLIGGVVGTFLLEESNPYAVYNQKIELLNTTKGLHNRLSEDILKSRSSLLLNYDPIVNKVKELNKKEKILCDANLIDGFNDEVIQENLTLLAKESKLKKSRIEEYKIIYTILKNSIKSLPIVANDLLKSGIKTHKNEINTLVKEILILNTQPDLGDTEYIEQLTQELTNNTSSFNQTQAELLRLLLKHSQIISNKTALLNQTTFFIVNTQINDYFTQIGLRLTNLLSQKVERGKKIGKILYGVILLLVLLISYAVNKIVQNQRKLRSFSNDLEKKVIQRTEVINEKNKKLTQSLSTIAFQAETIDQRNQKITASINYAKRIQSAILPSKEELASVLPSSFVLFKPKDIVSGDFFWLKEKNNRVIIGAFDCTGHGVSGAFMSLIGYTLLNNLVERKEKFMPHEILEELNINVISFLKQYQNNVQDGMDAGLCIFDRDTNELYFSGAHHSLLYIQDGEIQEVKGDRKHIGGVREKGVFTSHVVQVDERSSFYLFSDGYVDQFGGKDNKKYGKGKLKKLLLENYKYSFSEQHKIYDDVIESWMQDHTIINKQIDDILLMGFKLREPK